MGNNNQNNSNNSNNSSEKLRIRNNDCKSFVSDSEVFSMNRTSKWFCENVVNALFKNVFKDYDGSYCTLINTNQGPRVFVDLHFSKSNRVSNAPYEALIEKSQKLKNSGDTFSRVQSLNSKMNSSRIYELTQEAKDILSEFNPGEHDPKKIKWKDKMVETSGQNINGIVGANVKIITLDPIKMIKEVYGKYIKLSDGKLTDHIAEYSIEPVKQIQNMYTPGAGVELLLKLSCYDRGNVERSIMASGAVPQVTNNPMYPVV